jgi:ribosomal protein S18 acetylase RimI-like enzyme
MAEALGMSGDSSLDVRPARASDAEVLAPLVHASGPRLFDWIFAVDSADAIPFLVHCLRQRRALLGWANHWVAERDREIVASVALWSGAQVLGHDAFMVPRIVGYFGARAPKVIVRSLIAEAMLQKPRRDQLYLGHLAVAPGHRGRGIGRQLLDFAQAQARTRGLARILLDVAEDNPARRLYDRAGYVAGPLRPFRGRPRDAAADHIPMALVLD